ncbi:hypothetical protein [Lysinibacillus sp. ZYM-1]|uniref:hypothetical protein n=1 Tax=Lysinibacillus sp. ZYM-1 TaxID=1681184 RepID=UPI0006CE8663|nr:hypothetical protein [Lysinibacillus sp. ZYM-1]KPN96062.1 hypothetical protein AO843_18945 [Lysinibacillus sp. ZYM-1]
MELGALKQSIFNVFGWASVSLGLWTLIMINSWIIVGYDAPFTSRNFIILIFIFGIIATISKSSRSLGMWGIFLGCYLVLFMIVIFFVGWFIIPFP